MNKTSNRLPWQELTGSEVGLPETKAPSWSLRLIGPMIVVISLAHIPSVWLALNYFDPPKRFLWALLAAVLALSGTVRANRLGRGALCLSWGLVAWMGFRTLVRPVPTAELDVLFTWMLPLILLMLGAGLSRGERHWFLGGCLMLAAGIQVVWMVLQRLGMDPLFAETTAAMSYAPGRMVGTIGYHNQAVDFLALAVTGVILFSKSFPVRLGAMLSMLAMASLTANRGGILAFATAVLLFHVLFTARAFTSFGIKKRYQAVVGFALVAVAVASAGMLVPETRGRFQEILFKTRSSPAIQSRLHMAGIAVDMIREHPWTGAGAGEYALQYLDRLGARLPKEKNHPILGGLVFAREAHNDGLQFVAEFGVIGLLMLAGLIAVWAVREKRQFLKDPDTVFAGTFIAAFMTVASLFSFPWQTSMAGPMAGLLLGWWWPEGDSTKGNVDVEFSRLARGAIAFLSILMAVWYASELFMNVALPSVLEKDPAPASSAVLHPYAYRYRALIGASLAQKGNLAEAARELNAAKRGYRDLLLWNNLAHVYAQQGRWNEAAAIYERWEKCGLDYANALMNLTVSYEQMGRFGEAAHWLSLRRILFEDRSLRETKRLAVLYLRAQQPYAAREVLERSRHQWETDPVTTAEFANLTAVAAIGQGNLDDAEYWLRRALELNPELESARRNSEILEQMKPRE